MRIVLVSAYGLPHTGGVESVVHQVGCRLADRGHHVTHVTSAASGPGDLGGEVVPYRVVRVPAFNGLESRLGVPYPVFSPRLLGALRQELVEADVVHAHGYLYAGTCAAFALAPRAPARPARVLTEHVGHVRYESSALDRSQALAIAVLGRAAVRAADVTLVYHGGVESQLRRLAPAADVRWLGNGVDTERFRPPAASERAAVRAALGWDERPRALFVGRPVAKKGFDLAVAAAAVAGDGWRLAVAGPERLPAGTPDDVQLLGRLAPERMSTAYWAADALLLPSRGEGFPLAAQEAMASGLPVVLADDPGYRNMLDGAGPAVQLAAPAPQALAVALHAVRATDSRELAAIALAHARAAFSWPRVIDELEALYRELRTPPAAGAPKTAVTAGGAT